MFDVGRIVNVAKICTSHDCAGLDCPYYGISDVEKCRLMLMKHITDMLNDKKSTEAVKPTWHESVTMFECECGETLRASYNYCPNCGRVVDWSD